MDITDFIRRLEDIAPPEIAEDMDDGKIGLVIEGKREITRAACALDATKHTVTKAAESGADILVVHHPPIWHAVHRITGLKREITRAACALDATKHTVTKAAESGADILVVHHPPIWHAVHRITGLKREIFLPAFKAEMNIYSMHTNFDHARGGINDALGEFLELKNIEHMSLGVIGDCTQSLKEISQKLGGSMRVYGDIGRLEKNKSEGKTFRLAVVGGSGFDVELIEEAKDAGADVFLSAELKHDTIISQDIILAESTHYDLESVGMKKLAEKMGWTFIEDRPQRHDI